MNFEIFKNKKITDYFIGLIISISAAIYAIQQIVVGYYSDFSFLFTGIASFLITSYVFLFSFERVKRIIINDKSVGVMAVFCGICISRMGYLCKGIVFYQEGFRLIINVFRLRWYIISAIAVIYYLILFFDEVRNSITELLSKTSERLKKVYIIISVVLTIVIVFSYIRNIMWFQMFDNVNGMDSRWCYEVIYKDVNYYDIRHPILGNLLFPIYAVVNSILELVAPANLILRISAALFQILHIQCLLLMGLMLSALTKKMSSFLIYVVSFPTLLLFMAFEKYQICIFLVVLYVYEYVSDKKRAMTAVLLTGVIPTNGAIIFIELLGNRTIKEKFKSIIMIVFMGAATLVMSGRVFLLNFAEVSSQISKMHHTFGRSTLSFFERSCAFLNMIKGSFIGLSSVITGKAYSWENVCSIPDLLSIFLLVIILVGIITKFKSVITKVCLFVLVESFALIVLINWAPYEAPVFSIFFSWAYIVLFVYGIEFLLGFIVNKRKMIEVSLIILMAIINLSMVIDIDQFLMEANPQEVVMPVQQRSGLIQDK